MAPVDTEICHVNFITKIAPKLHFYVIKGRLTLYCTQKTVSCVASKKIDLHSEAERKFSVFYYLLEILREISPRVLALTAAFLRVSLTFHCLDFFL